jgi:tetratricopeptide (TPR) repeat protein
LEKYQQALVIVREIGERLGEGVVLNNIGEVYNNLGQYPKALEFYQQALAIRREVSDRKGEGVTLNNMGLVYRRPRTVPQSLGILSTSFSDSPRS